MLIFDRKGFISGKQCVYEPVKEKKVILQPVLDKEGKPVLDKDGKPQIKEVEKELEIMKKYNFKPNDKGKSFSFVDESYVLKKYPLLFIKA